MTKRNNRIVSLITAVMFSLTLTAGIAAKEVKASELNNNLRELLKKKSTTLFSEKEVVKRLEKKYGKSLNNNDNVQAVKKNPDEKVRVIIELKDKPVLKGTSYNLSGTNNSKLQSVKPEVDALKAEQKKVITKATQMTGAKVRNTYNYLFNGFSMEVKRGEVENLKKIPGVKKVSEVKYYKTATASSKGLTQAFDAWKDYGVKGEGMVVSIVDTGIDYNHKDMKITDVNKDKLNSSNVLKDKDAGKFFTDKIPYGYNFADGNLDIIDGEGNSMHGMHVAGIVGANGSEDQVKANKAVQGVAPECQLLAMKVFSNDPNNPYASSDDIVEAIESSVIHGADVINMSLGATAGVEDVNDPEQQAIKTAVDNGVMVVVAAGNETYSTYPYKIPELKDTGLVCAPGVSKDAFTVASFENSKVVYKTFDVTGLNEPMKYVESEIDPFNVLKGQYELVDCGLGRADENANDFEGKNLQGKIALIKRGDIDFVTKKVNAQKAGAAGVIVYNKDGMEDFFEMYGDAAVKIPSIMVGNSDGLKLLKNIASQGKVSFNGNVIVLDNPARNDMSDFTSWGAETNLEFKPEITAPGGNIYSTVNNNNYKVMSGTSMATPHTSGAEALILQKLKNTNSNLSGRQLVEFAKTTTINTAKVEMDKQHEGTPYSPRRQGGGLIQIENAIKNRVKVTDLAGNPTIALKEISTTSTINLTLHNYNEKEVTYSLDNLGGAYTETNELLTDGQMSYDVKIDGAAVTFDKETVTIPANGEAVVNATITLPNNFKTEQFVEGYIKFKSSDEVNVPSLAVPYMGFYGDWSKQANVDAPIWDANSYFGITTLLSKSLENGEKTLLGVTGFDEYDSPIVNKDAIAISPNNDGYDDNLLPYIGFLRNCKDVNIDLLDKDGKVIRNLAVDQNATKSFYDPATTTFSAEGRDNWIWDGKLYNVQTGTYDIAPQGSYKIRVTSKLDYLKANPQVMEMPVKVDTTAPEIKVLSSAGSTNATYTLSWTVKDNLSGISPLQYITLNGNENPEDVKIEEKNGVYSCVLSLPQKENIIKITAMDTAFNAEDKEFKVCIDTTAPTGNITYSTAALTNKNVIATLTPSEKVTVTNNDGKLTHEFTSNGSFIFEFVDAAGNKGTATATVKNIDKVVPTATISYSTTATTNKNVIATIKPSEKVTVTNNGGKLSYEFTKNGSFTFEFVDAAGNKGTATAVVKNIDKTTPIAAISYSTISATNKNVIVTLVPYETVLVLNNSGKFTYEFSNNGSFTFEFIDLAGNRGIATAMVTYIDKVAPTASLSYSTTSPTNKNVIATLKPSEKITVTNNGGKSSYEFTKNGSFTFEFVDAAGNKGTATAVVRNIDKVAPTATIVYSTTSPTNKNVIATLKLSEKATVINNGGKLTYEFKQNGSFTFEFVDAAGNKGKATAVVKNIDRTAPVITVSGVQNGKIYYGTVSPKVSVNDSTAAVTMILDGKAYNGKTISTRGKHKLVIQAVDKAANISKLEINFEIKAATKIKASGRGIYETIM